MRKYQFDKLIRSKIPARMEDEGVSVNRNSLSESEYLSELKRKLLEEAQEVHDADSKDDLTIELADVLEVIRAIADANAISMEDIENAQLKKREINGHFLPENYINYIEVAEDNHKVIDYLENKNRPYKLES